MKMNQTESYSLDSSPESYNSEEGMRLHFVIFTSLSTILVTFINILVITVLVKNKQLMGSTRPFCLHMAVADIVNSLALYIFLIRSGSNITELCIMYLALFTPSLMCSQMLVTVSLIERYMGVCRRNLYPRYMTKRNIHCMLTVSWLYALLQSCLMVIGLKHDITGSLCYYQLMYQKWLYLAQTSQMIILAVLDVVLWSKIMFKAHEFYRNHLNIISMYQMNAAGVRSRNMHASIRNGKIVGYLTLILLVCFTPLNAYQLFLGLRDDNTELNSFALKVGIACTALGALNGLLNPVLYTLKKKAFRYHCKRMICCEREGYSSVSPTSRIVVPRDNQRSMTSGNNVRIPQVFTTSV